jgi:hypothetical protein
MCREIQGENNEFFKLLRSDVWKLFLCFSQQNAYDYSLLTTYSGGVLFKIE